jgi:methionyl-tRNA synthetase
MAEPFYITTAIVYPNGRPHIGFAYEVIAADAIARYHRLSGRDVFFLTGTDEHGLKMAQKARDLDITPIELTDEMSAAYREMDDILNISYDRFIRTTEPVHYEASQAIWRAMEANGDIYLGRYEGWYSVRDEAFYDEKELIEGEGGRNCRRRIPRSSGPSRRAGSSAFRLMPIGCWRITRRIPNSSAPIRAATKF